MLSETLRNEITRLLSRYPRKEAAVIPALHLVHKEFGYIPDAAVRELAEMLSLQPTRIADVLSFYTMFSQKPLGRYHIQICRTLSCHSLGSPELLEYLESRCGVRANQGTSADGRFSIETVECLGACANAPVIQVNGELIENVTREKLNHLLTQWSAENS